MAYTDDPLTDDEWPDEDDDDGPTSLVPCGECGEMIAEDSPQCSHCKTWGPAAAGGALGRGLWRVAWSVAVIVLIVVILVVWHGLGR